MKNTNLAYGLLLGTIVLAAGLVAYVRTQNPNHTVTLDAAGIVQELRDINEMVTVRYVVQHTLARRGEPGGDSGLVMVQGTVLASIDLGNLKPEEVQLSGNTVDLRLPPPKITGVSIDDGQTRVWEKKISMWTSRPDTEAELEAGLRRQALAELQQAAVQAGILDEADRNARRAIRRVLLAAGMLRVNFR